MNIHSERETEQFLRLSAEVLQRFQVHPSIPTDLSASSWAEILVAAAPVLLALFGEPTSAAGVLEDTLGRLFSKLDEVNAALDRIEQHVAALEAKHDAAVLARFRASMRELRDGMRARQGSYRHQLMHGARTRLTELSELPPGLTYGSFSSQAISAASSMLVAMIDTWYGEIESAHRYHLRAPIADPLWAEGFLGARFIDGIAGAALRRLEQDHQQRAVVERTKRHGFVLHKIGTALIGVAAVALNPAGAGVHVGNVSRSIASYDSEATQDRARIEALRALAQVTRDQRAALIREAALARLNAVG